MKNLLKTTILVIVVLLITVYCLSSTTTTILSEASESTTSEYILTVYVYDAETKKPIDDAMVSVSPRWLEVLWSNTTNATGYATFLLEEYEYGYRASAGKSGYRPNGTPLFLLDRNMTVNISLTPRGPTYNLTVYVYDEIKGEPIAGASVVASPTRDFSHYNYTNATGYATLMLEEDEYCIKIRRHYYDTKTISLLRFYEDITINVSLIPAKSLKYSSLSVHVYDAETKEPIDNTFILVYDLSKDALFDSVATNSTGYAFSMLPKNKHYIIKAEKFGYEAHEASPLLLNGSMTVNITLVPLKSSGGSATGNFVFISIGILIAIGIIVTSIIIMRHSSKKG